jgi:hypothetical protein
MFLGIPDNALNEEILKQRLKFVSELMIDKIYIPAYHENGNPQHNLINKVCMELFDRDRIEQYCSYSRTDLMIKGKYEIVPTPAEMELKNKALDCFRSQINLPSMKEHFEFVRNKSEYLI